MTKDECITLLKKYMSILKDKYGITSLSLFGSTARGEQKEGSDIDLFVDTRDAKSVPSDGCQGVFGGGDRLFCRYRPQSSKSESSFKKTYFKGWNLCLLRVKV